VAFDSGKGHVEIIFAFHSIARNALRGRVVETRVALLRHRMAEVYAVPGAAAPAPACPYPVWHEYVGTVTVARLHVQPDSLGTLSRTTAAVENGCHKDGGGELTLLPTGPKFGRQRRFLLLDGLPQRRL
jgi:hypothetical protein